jgi:hypothetical protein
MEQERADKLRRSQFHDFLFAPIGIIMPEEKDLSIFHLEDAVISDSDPVRISSQIIDEKADHEF